jgi:ethanolamine ammonia-lyase small subunit
MPNSIHNLDTKWFRNDTGEFPAIVMGLNIPHAETADSFLDHVIEQFKCQRMCSPPATANMTITIAGNMTAEQFCEMWTRRSADDPILRTFMSMMVLADVLHIRGRELLDRASLIPSVSSQPPSGSPPASLDSASFLEQVRSMTPARILVGRAGAAYKTATWLKLRADHAFAKDAVFAEIDLVADLGDAFVAEWNLFEVGTLAQTKNDFLLRPELGRSLSATARTELSNRCVPCADLQVVIADGLSATAVRTQVPTLLPLLSQQAAQRGWKFGQPFLIRHARVGVLNDIGETLDPAVVVLLIGERPGLATAQSLSAYMAFKPRAGHDDSRRNLISNIHARGVPPDQAADRIARLAEQMLALKTSGVHVKEQGIALMPPAPSRRFLE